MTDSGAAQGPPGLRRVEHAGLTVTDVDAAYHFFVELLGGEFLFEIGRFVSAATNSRFTSLTWRRRWRI